MGGSCTKDKTIKDSVAISDLVNKDDLKAANNLNNISNNQNLGKISTNSITKSTFEKNNLKNGDLPFPEQTIFKSNNESNSETPSNIQKTLLQSQFKTEFPSTKIIQVHRASSKKVNVNSENPKNSVIESEVLTVLKPSNENMVDGELIDNCFKKNIFMRNLDSHVRKEIIKQMIYCYVPKNTIIFNQGQVGNYFYIIKQGKVDLYINGEQKKTLRYSESFGELALLYGALRSGSIKSTEDTYMWCLERKKFKHIIEYLNTTSYEENRSFIYSIPILNNMERNLLTLLASNLIKVTYDPGSYIVKEGESADCIYIIKEGKVLCRKNESVIRNLSKGDSFGLNSILNDSTRSMDVIAETVCVCYSISVDTLTKIIGKDFKNTLYLNFIKMAIKTSMELSKINNSMIESTYPSFKVKKFKCGEMVFSKSSNLENKIIIIIEGSLCYNMIDKVNTMAKVVFAERGKLIYRNDHFTSSSKNIKPDIYAEPDCFLLEAGIDEFIKYLGGSIENITEKSNLMESLQKIPLFKNFRMKHLNLITNAIKTEEFKKDEVIIREKEEGSKFYIVKFGKVDIYVNSKYIRTLNENEYFGEKSLFIKEPRSATVLASSDKVILYVLDHEIFNLLDINVRNYIINRIPLQDNTVVLSQLDYIQTLGKGNFGNVYLVTSNKNKCFYAIKVINRRQIDQDQLHPNLEMERRILLKIDHPFIMKLVKTLKDNEDIYFLSEYIRGKELWDVIRDIGLLNKQQTLFYCSSIMLAVEYLHKRKFIYRDIKPENIIVNESGYIKIIDFGTAKEIDDRTSTIIGTPHYMAPEVILGEGYTFNIDFWSIGVCIYEFMCGGVPFGESCDDPIDVYTAIVNNELHFPQFIKDPEFKMFAKEMLKKSPVKRLNNLKQIMNHVYLQGFDWEGVESLITKAPYIPDITALDLEKNKPINFLKFMDKNRKKSTKNCVIPTNVQQTYDQWYEEF